LIQVIEIRTYCSGKTFIYEMFFPLFIPIPIPMGTGNRRCYRYEGRREPPVYVMLGALPPDFLRVQPTAEQKQQAADQVAAMHIQNQMLHQARQPTNVGRLQVSVMSAVLNKNYGMARMDPYVRMKIGHQVYETQTDVNGAKNPRWSKTFQIYQIPKGVSIHLEIFDERTLTEDELIAWVTVPIPEVVFQAETVDEWYSLNGKLGEGAEGTINVVMSYTTGPAPMAGPVMMMPGVYQADGGAHGFPGYTTLPVYPVTPPHQQAPQVQPISEEDLKVMGEMFPGVEAEVVKSVLEASNGNKETAINSLLQMQE